MLELSDPAWSRLTTAYGEGDEAAELLRRLRPDAANGELRQELIELLLHQGTIYASTLAAMPYLADMAEKAGDEEALIDLYIAGGMMTAGREGESGEPVERSGEFRRSRQGELDAKIVRSIAAGWREGVSRLAALHERAARQALKAVQAGSAEAVYLLAAHAAYAGHAEAARLLFEGPAGDEYAGICPSCGADWYVRPEAGGSRSEGEPERWVVYTDDPVMPGTDGLPSADVRPAAQAELRPALRMLGSEARRLGARRLARAIPSLDGRASCPACGREASVWEALTAWRRT
ncbi:hypothetical protein [Saccharibacillus alkalitolerans]|uniref:Uncharacterized protein n=1 Tax=Saccharibacillus alkalitolerans TaxID=2705290 RepID=A0ABX0F4C6_9BACL|nr:hypothetical protein [Saccharibacillus alkalitolerans]NGZ75280.1 hypothetical protein [Saccharibacillus alkalitolerans]